ncbi:hypothetical protein ES706_05229 [subsurface metagenome]
MDPEVGYPNTNFVYRVKYTDEDNDAPASGYPKVHIKKGELEIDRSPFAMSEVDPIDMTYSDGKLYAYTRSGVGPGTNYTYCFEAKDVWNDSATGDPTNPLEAPDVTNNAPTLSWTGETNYAEDGLDPETGYPDTNFVYRVRYTDQDDDGPASGYPKVHIKKGGLEIDGSPFAMSEVDPGDTNYTDGKLYTYTKSGLVPGTDYTYYFEAKDIWNASATGDPTSSLDGPNVESGPYYIKGYVKDSDGDGISGVTVTLSGTVSNSCITVNSGYYEFLNLVSGNYTVTPNKSGWSFSPVFYFYGPLNSDQDNQNFIGTPYYYIKGYVKDSDGDGISGVTVTLSGAASKSYATESSGYYEFLNLASGNYTVTPNRSGWSFSPVNYAYGPLDSDQESQNFTGTPSPVLGAGGEVKIRGGEKGYVNPLKGEVAKINFQPSGEGTVNVKIFTLRGLLVWEKSKNVSGVQDFIEWDCSNKENDVVASGIYIVYVEGPGIKATKKVAVLK